MDKFIMTLYMVLGILLRIGIPFGATLLLAWFLRRLDTKWREEAMQVQLGETVLHEIWLSTPCWENANCSEEQRENCPAYQQTNTSCWEVFRDTNGLNTKCQECEYRKELLIPIRINKETSRR